jgi:3-deoxy-D-manno-octulosonate 8-phosphate phosphatase (KDO 8-P phosphatase)
MSANAIPVTAPDALERARAVRLMVFDVDGILTDGRLFLTDSGEEMKAFHTLDGQGLKMLRESGVEIAILTARQSRVVARRAAELGITHVRQGAADKRAGFADILADCGLQAANAGYIGDDLVDLPVLTRCAFAASVPEAPEAIRSRVHYITSAAGGHGAAREVCEFILRAQGRFEQALARYLE